MGDISKAMDFMPGGNGNNARIFLHFPCFDGLVSAAIATNYLEGVKGWSVNEYIPVGYELSAFWLEKNLPIRSAVVDFLYHPQAAFWADHHSTSFLTEWSRISFLERESDDMLLYDRNVPSCAKLLFDRLGIHLTDAARFGDMAYWANRTDSAAYASVDEAVFAKEPAFEINLSLGVDEKVSREYLDLLLKAMRELPLGEISLLPAVRDRVKIGRRRIAEGLKEVEKSIRLEVGEIAVLEATQTSRNIVDRYSAYVFFPEARYSVALVRSRETSKITAMRNPWRDFTSVPLGELFKKYGGGGHQRVASVLVPEALDARDMLRDIVADIRRNDVGDGVEAKRAFG